MVESEANCLTEDEMLGAVLYGHMEMQRVIEAIEALAAEAGKPKWTFEPEPENEALRDAVAAAVKADLGEAYRITDKMERQTRVGELRNKALELAEGEDEQGESGTAGPLAPF